METLKKLSAYLGLHPLVGAGMILADWLLFSGETVSFGASWPVSLVVGLLLTVPSLLIQRYGYGDDWGGALWKSLLVGGLTAIPTAIPSIGTGILTLLGVPRLSDPENDRSAEGP